MDGEREDSAQAALRMRVIEATARALAAEGVRRIALFGAGRHTRPIVRQPWQAFGIEVVLIADDAPTQRALAGVPVRTPEAWRDEGVPAIDAVVVSSYMHEETLAKRAEAAFGVIGIPVVRLYGGELRSYEPAEVEARLAERVGLSADEARWLVEHRDERHDATVGMIRPERTEFHLRRYELAADIIAASPGARVGDLACGTGYGARLLIAQGLAEACVGVDLDGHAVAYAGRYHTMGGRASFRSASVTETGIDTDSLDAIASFETIEHVAETDSMLREFARVLKPGGRLVISTPNRMGPTPYHVHDFGLPDFRAALERWFTIDAWLGQLPIDDVFDPTLPPGVFGLDIGAAVDGRPDRFGRSPHALIAVCRAKDCETVEPGVRRIATRHGPIVLACPNDIASWRAETLLTKEPETLEWIDAFEDGDVFWDIGANMGVYSLYAAAAGRASRVLAFEPSPWNAALLADQIRLNGMTDRVESHTLAVSNTTGPGTLFMRRTDAAGAGSSFAEPVGEFGERFEASHRQAAMGVRMDDLVAWGAPQPNRIKIDVDGAEERVLAGAPATLADPRLKSVSIELDVSRTDLMERVRRALEAAGLRFDGQRQSPEFAVGQNASLYNVRFTRG